MFPARDNGTVQEYFKAGIEEFVAKAGTLVKGMPSLEFIIRRARSMPPLSQTGVVAVSTFENEKVTRKRVANLNAGCRPPLSSSKIS